MTSCGHVVIYGIYLDYDCEVKMMSCPLPVYVYIYIATSIIL